MINNKYLMLAIVNLFVSFFFVLSSHAQPTTLSIGNGYGLPGQTDYSVAVSFDNPIDKIKGIEVFVCDVDDYLYCTGCEATERTTGFSCICVEVDGCANVIFIDFGGNVFDEGSGPIFTLTYDISPLAPLDECRVLYPESLKVAGENNESIAAVSLPGNFYFCGDDCECEGNFDGDEDQDGSDAYNFKQDFGRHQYNDPCESINPCTGNFDCDEDVDGGDAFTFKTDFGRHQYNNPCPNCGPNPWCDYP